MISFQPSGTLLNETVPPHFTTGFEGGGGDVGHVPTVKIPLPFVALMSLLSASRHW